MPTIFTSSQSGAFDRIGAILLRCCRLAQALTPIQMATAATESYPWWPDKLAILHCIAQQEGETVRTVASPLRMAIPASARQQAWRSPRNLLNMLSLTV